MAPGYPPPGYPGSGYSMSYPNYAGYPSHHMVKDKKKFPRIKISLQILKFDDCYLYSSFNEVLRV